jgi:hypothetical protein
MYSIFLYYNELIKPYLLIVTHAISYYFTKIAVIFDNIIRSVGEHGDEKEITQYVKNQGRNPEEYEQIYENKELELF